MYATVLIIKYQHLVSQFYFVDVLTKYFYQVSEAEQKI